MNKLKCVAGCKHFTGGEVKHHKDCPYYPESLSKMYDDLKEDVDKLNEPAASKCDGGEREALLFAFISWYAERYEMAFTDYFKNRLIDEFKSKQ